MKKLKDINWNQVYCFYEVARKLSMKEAGKLLGVSTPTVSEQIKRLEILLGVTLFRRYPRRIQLTPEGEALFACARDMFEAGGRFLDLVSATSIGGYATRVGIQESVAESEAIQIVDHYWDLFAPYGTVNTIREQHFEFLVDRILKGELDWAISLERPKSPRIEHASLGEFEIVYGCSPRLFRKFRHPVDLVRSIPMARCTWDRVLNEAIDDNLRANDVFPEEILATDHRELALDLAKRGRCVIARTRGAAEREGPALKWFSLGKPITLTLYAFWLKASERMMSIRKLIELLGSKGPPPTLDDPDLQIRVAEIPPERLA